MPSHATCRDEIEALHDFFVGWYTGRTAVDSCDRLDRALNADFEMVTPDGTRHGQEAVVEMVREGYDGRDADAFNIEIRNVETRYAVDDHALVRYEEWQETPAETTGRLSTVLFEEAPDAPGDVRWLDLHETWLDGPADDA